ncbi:MAG: hypothetical protein PHD81_01630 [Candidatus Nanoarchaeia archaeon]|nr:hypothetical protein [Candidatus Nanoarchaeia archaeon]MDD5587789.1 hypothetical protein [Candidatus Nanoarchaeia archaeon]
MKKRKNSNLDKINEKLKRLSKPKHHAVEFDQDELDRIEKRLRVGLHDKPLTKNFYKNIIKGIFGAFISLIIFYIFFNNPQLYINFNTTKIFVLLLTSFLICNALIYLKRDIYVHVKFLIFPKKAILIYLSSLFFLLLAGLIIEKNLILVLKQTALVSILAAIFSGIFNFIIKEI